MLWSANDINYHSFSKKALCTKELSCRHLQDDVRAQMDFEALIAGSDMLTFTKLFGSFFAEIVHEPLEDEVLPEQELNSNPVPIDNFSHGAYKLDPVTDEQTTGSSTQTQCSEETRELTIYNTVVNK